MNQAKESAKQAAQTAKEKSSEVAREVTQQVKRTAGEVTHEVKEHVSETVGQARRKVEEGASDQKRQLADQIENVANAVRRAGDEMGGGQQNQLGSYADSAAEQLNNLSTYLRDHDLTQILDDARGYARRQPEIFFTGALVAGFLAGRFFRSGSGQQSYRSTYDSGYNPNYAYDYGSQYGSEYGSSYGQGGSRQGTYGQGMYGQEEARDIPVAAPNEQSDKEGGYSGQVTTAWTPAEQALHARSEDE
jgi:hypothetical protein